MKPLYEPKGKAKEYGDYAVNIYTGCPHNCFYCFAPGVLHKDKKTFHADVRPREGIVDALRLQIEKEKITDKLVHLCFTCDPYPNGCDTSVTREVIKVLKETGNHVQILTKGDGRKDFDLLDSGDWFGITYAGYRDPTFAPDSEPNAIRPIDRIVQLSDAKRRGVRTWISFEPVIDAHDVLLQLRLGTFSGIADKIKIGKLNYHHSDIDWKSFGEKAEKICKMWGYDYYIKDSLRQEMEK